MNRVNLDFAQIRAVDGSRATGFEELCAQLARDELPGGSFFERKGIQDAGVECFAILPDGTEWGWQAKYFDSVGGSQWSQLDESVETALEKHPQLVRYFVCLPLDLPDPRVEGQRSARERWNQHVDKWSEWASARRMEVEFVLWGRHELLDRLAKPENVGKVRFWFGARLFDQSWFEVRLDEAHKTAGPRYTPELNIELTIAAKLEAFGRTPAFFEDIKAHARSIRTDLRAFGRSTSVLPDPDLVAASKQISEKVGAVLSEFRNIRVEPAGDLVFQSIEERLATAEQDEEELEGLLFEREREYDKDNDRVDRRTPDVYASNPFKDQRIHLRQLGDRLYAAREALRLADELAGNSLMILKGAAGTGKTHLLCDFAKQRLEAGQPTVLLMGQQFVGTEPPWTQALQLLDLPDLGMEEFVGALEAAAQAAGYRALVLVDAVNEGAGRQIWPAHLAGFIGHIERSPWIGLVLSVRESYEETLVEAGIRDRAVHIEHHGFEGLEYSAARAYFMHYGIEFPSTPLLAPEFNNPFYLKTLCVGLSETGQKRLPRGFQGVTFASRLFLDAVNKRLSDQLDFDERRELVQQAVRAFAARTAESGNRWLSLSSARELVDGLLPGRDFERSLYRGLVTEGVLIEEAGLSREEGEEVVFFGYDRLGDHLVAETMLRSLGAENMSARGKTSTLTRWLMKLKLSMAIHIQRDRQWRSLCDPGRYFPRGVLEALSVQVPERTGMELVELHGGVSKRTGIGNAFRQSIVWRAPGAISDSTMPALDAYIRTEPDLFETLDSLLTIASLPEHPLNAYYLDQQLRKVPMPDRDSWWSVYLHHAWRTEGPVDRLVDWAWSVPLDKDIEEQTLDLCAIALCWMFTSSNRFLRDRATKSLVNLLTHRLEAVARLVTFFADVDDPYITERVYAVAYGTAMRSQDPEEVGHLADRVYQLVFATGKPIPHILLRDYARGVVERALYLEADIDVDTELVRPPYTSQWPRIPTEDEIKPLMPDWSEGSHDSGDTIWSRNRIGSSVMNDDFAWYVIGTNSSPKGWLSLRLDEPVWQSHDERLAKLIEDFSDEEKTAWEAFEHANAALSRLAPVKVTVITEGDEDSATSEENGIESAEGGELDGDIAEAQMQAESRLTALESVLTKEHATSLESILRARANSRFTRESAPRFDLGKIQRYILWRVFDLGWTTERFGEFDRFAIGFEGRAASKAERLGKKYQWIAYHEILAFISDHFQYREWLREEDAAKKYDGPWQETLRDVDPSCTLRRTRGGTSWSGHAPAWWAPAQYQGWDTPRDPMEWTRDFDNLPSIGDLLISTSPNSGSPWITAQGYLNWHQPAPKDLETTDVERRDIWYRLIGYLVHERDTRLYMEWAEQVDFWGNWMPDPPDIYGMYLGEHGWSPASHYFEHPYFGDPGWIQPSHGCPIKVRVAGVEYVRESGGFDCSVDENLRLRLPARYMISGLDIEWSGRGAEYLDPQGEAVGLDPTVFEEGPSALLLGSRALKTFLSQNGYSICWAVLGERRALGPGITPEYGASLRLTGAYTLEDAAPVGFLKCIIDLRDDETGEISSEVLSVVRSDD